jgi:hypothetical protein
MTSPLLVLASWLALSAAPVAAQTPPARVETAYQAVLATAGRLKDPQLRQETLDAVGPKPCLRHRTGLDATTRQTVLARLKAEGFLAADADGRGVFVPVADEGGPCPTLVSPFVLAPGGDLKGHHGWPGGLPEHVDFNQRSGLWLAGAYAQAGDLPVDTDLVTAAVLWHDWAKALVLSWNPDGTLPAEARIAGTSAHHVLGLSETMARGLPARLVIVQACAHEAPLGDRAPQVARWVAAAAVIARVDPVARGYLKPDGALNWGPQSNGDESVWRECLIHNSSDDNFIHSVQAQKVADAVLRRLAPQFGIDPAGPDYLNGFRHPVLSRLGADRLQALATTGGDAAVAKAIAEVMKPLL